MHFVRTATIVNFKRAAYNTLKTVAYSTEKHSTHVLTF